MGKIKRFFRDSIIKKAIVFIPLIIFVFVCLFVFKSLNTKADTIYKLITDSNGITWQYGYNATDKELEVSFFESTNSITEITIPDESYFKENDSSITEINNYKFTNYIDYDLGTPKEFDSVVTSIDLSNVNVVDGIKPLSDNSSDEVMNITLNPTSSKIGYDVFRDLKINISNLDKVTDISGGAFYRTTFSDTNINLPNLNTLGDGTFELSNITTLKINVPIIGVSAFKNCTSLTSVEIMDKVVQLKDAAFEGDSALTSFNFNHIKALNNNAFRNCTAFSPDIYNTELEYIGTGVFSGDVSLTGNLKIPDKVTQILDSTFEGASLTGVDLNNVEFIGTYAFDNNNISNLNLRNVKRIDYRAFSKNNLSTLYLPKSLVWLEDGYIFSDNQNLRKVTVAFDTTSTKIGHLKYVLGYRSSEYVEEVEFIAPYSANDDAIINYSGASRYYRTNPSNIKWLYNPSTGKEESDPSEILDDLNPEYGNAMSYKNVLQTLFLFDMGNLKKVVVGEGYEFIGSSQASFNNSIQYIYFPSTLKGIGINAFEQVFRNNYSYINLPNSLEYIGRGAFRDAEKMNINVNLPNLKTLGSNAFQYSGITSIKYNNKLKHIGEHTASHCQNLKTVILDCDYFGIQDFKNDSGSEWYDSRKNAFSNSFYQDNNVFQYDLIKFTSNVKTKPLEWEYKNNNSLFSNIKAKEIDLEDVEWEQMVGHDFVGANINTLKLPKNLKVINDDMFYQADIKNSIEIPSSVTRIGNSAFASAKFTLKGNLPSGLKSIGNGAFFNNSSFNDMIIPSTVENIGKGAFTYANRNSITFSCNLTPSVTSGQTISQLIWGSDINTLIFDENVKELPSQQLSGSLENESASSEFYDTSVNKIIFKGLEVIPPKAFFENKHIKEIDFSACNNISDIGANAFYKLNLQKDIVLPDTIKHIYNKAFMGAGFKVSSNLPKNLETIGENAFYDTIYNDDIVIPKSVKSIGQSAFQEHTVWGSNSYIATYPTISRNSITFENALKPTVTKGQTISTLLWASTHNKIIFGDNVTELPTKTLNKDKSVDASTPEFYNLDVKKVIFNNLIELPKKAFFDNKNIEEVTFSEDPNLSKIGSHAFYETTNLNKLKLYHDLDLTIDDHAFHGSGLTSLNDNEGIDVNNDKITLTGDCTFQNMPNILSLEISNKLNNGVIPEGTFANNTNLEKVILEDGVTNINSGAFANTNNLKTFVMYGNTDIANKDKNQTITLKNINNINFYSNSLIKNNFSIKANNSEVVTNNDLVYNETTKNYEFKYEFSGDITLTTTDDIIMKKDQYNNIYIEDMNDYNTTISSTANLYCYLKNPHCNDWNNTYKTYKEKEDSDLYYLDEVLYLDSNQVSVKLINNGKDIKKDGLSLYALRRDGVILISDDWGKMTDAKMYVDSGITIRNYDSSTTDPRKMIFNTNRDFDKLDLTTNSNFDEVTYVIGEEDPITGKTNVEFIYPNVVVDTTAETTLKSSGSYADIIYSDGCGGEAFSNVIYEDVKIGDPTPKYNGVPTREGYEFIGWNTDISDIVEGDVIYTAKWKKIDNNYPIINKDIPTINDGLINPPTNRNIIYLISILTIIIISIAFRRSFVKRNS